MAKKQKKPFAISPFGARIIVERKKLGNVSEGGIVLPGKNNEIMLESVVVAIGDDVENIPVEVGDKILVSRYGGTDIEVDKETYVIVSMDDVLGRMN